MTNTIDVIYTAATTGFVGSFNAYTGIAVAAIGTLLGLALAAKFLPRKKKVV